MEAFTRDELLLIGVVLGCRAIEVRDIICGPRYCPANEEFRNGDLSYARLLQAASAKAERMADQLKGV